MLAWEKLKESFISVIPIIVLVSLLQFVLPQLRHDYPAFLVGGLLLILGLGIFLVGTELSITPVGQKTGAALTSRRSLSLMLGVAFVVGFLATVAEPDVQVLSDQVASVDTSISSSNLILIIGLGVGFFVAVAMLRSVLRISLVKLLTAFYLLVFICAYLTHPAFLGVAFDAGGATTGPLTVPFIMALGIGVAATYSRDSHSGDLSFGFVGLASIGPILSVLILGILLKDNQMAQATQAVSTPLPLWDHFLHLIPEVSHEVFMALSPLVVLFILFQLFLLHMPPMQVARMIVGLVYTFLGIVLFFIGVKGGFIPMGTTLGNTLALYPWSLVPMGLILGAVVVCAEPAVWVLNEQVEQVSGGHIKRRLMLFSLSLGVACAVGLAMLRYLLNLDLLYILIIGYLITFSLTRFCPPMFTAIAFDSGGVASGPMASSFILSFTLGVSSALQGGSAGEAFGVIALIAMTPLIAIQILGILYAHKERAALSRQQARAKEIHKDTL